MVESLHRADTLSSMSETTTYDVIDKLTALREEYRRNGYETPASVKLRKSTQAGDTRYYVEVEGIKLGWTINVGEAPAQWGTWIADGVGQGTRFGAFEQSRKIAVEEIIWAAGLPDIARKIAEAHIRTTELLAWNSSTTHKGKTS